MNTNQDNRELWLQARALGGNPQGEWTYPLLFWRARVSHPDGLDFCYEDLTTWEQLSALVDFTTSMSQQGISPHQVYSVTLGLDVYDEMYYAPEGRLTLPAPEEPYRGRHVVQLVGMENDDTLVFMNSWGGTRWGDDGYGYISRAYFENHVDLVLAIRPAAFGSSLALDGELKRRSWAQGRPGTVLLDDIRAAWFTQNRPFGKSVVLQGEPHDLIGRRLFTVDGEPFQIVELRLGSCLVGRLHVEHSSQVSIVRELWVPPNARRNGYGSQLLEVAHEFARRIGNTRMVIFFHEADVHHADAAYSFAQDHEYGLTSSESKRPNLSAIATRSLVTTRQEHQGD